jgi:hypothetical protein
MVFRIDVYFLKSSSAGQATAARREQTLSPLCMCIHNFMNVELLSPGK